MNDELWTMIKIFIVLIILIIYSSKMLKFKVEIKFFNSRTFKCLTWAELIKWEEELLSSVTIFTFKLHERFIDLIVKVLIIQL